MPDEAYRRIGNPLSDQAEATSWNRSAGKNDVRILIELQVISMLLYQISGSTEDLTQMRQSAADSIT